MSSSQQNNRDASGGGHDLTPTHPSPAPQSPGREDDRLWYHPDIDRLQAERLLLSSSPADGASCDGVFLVRDSQSAPGDQVLSVRFGAGVLHYQVRRHEDDTLYSIDEGRRIHGIDALIQHYRCRASDGGRDCLAVRLTRCVQGVAPPSALCRQGTANLLHRATACGDDNIVSALINAGYPQLHAKDAAGQTAVHLAASLGRLGILRQLVVAGCTMNVRDTSGATPLHYAARHNRPLIVHELVEAALANVQARASDTDRVPLHEAAAAGSEEAARALLAQRAPVRPRDSHNQLPEQLAAAAGHWRLRQLLMSHQPPVPRRMRSDFQHGRLSRAEAEQRLQAGGGNDGDFLVRTSTRSGHGHVLSMVHGQRTYHFEISEVRARVPFACTPLTTDDNDNASNVSHGPDSERVLVYIDDGPYLDSLEHLVDHYSFMSDGLMCRLAHPVPPSAEDALRAVTDQRLSVVGAAAPATAAVSPQPQPRVLPRPGLIVLSDLEFGAVIGRGEFGCVYQGRWRHPCGHLVDVAIKTQNVAMSTNSGQQRSTTDIGDHESEALLREATCLKRLSHANIVRFLGMVQYYRLMMVQELAPLGSLLTFVQNQPNSRVTAADRRLWLHQVAEGMIYMSNQRVVHRDLAARNILLASPTHAKISDFGFARMQQANRDYYRVTSGGRWPVKWCAPESMHYGTFSSASDVWSFGVLAWEVYSGGQQPYSDKPGVEAFFEVVERGGRLSAPSLCPDCVYQALIKCWAYAPHERPSFQQLAEFFGCEAVGEDVVNLEQLQQQLSYVNVAALAERVKVSLTAEEADALEHSDNGAEGTGINDVSLGDGEDVSDVVRSTTLKFSDNNNNNTKNTNDTLSMPNDGCQAVPSGGENINDTNATPPPETSTDAQLYDSPRFHSLVRPSARRDHRHDASSGGDGGAASDGDHRQQLSRFKTPPRTGTSVDNELADSAATETEGVECASLAGELYDSPRSHTLQRLKKSPRSDST